MSDNLIHKTRPSRWAPGFLALLLLGLGLLFLGAGASPVSETSSIAASAQPTPTYVSELAPAVMVAPREPATLPASGATGPNGGTPLPKAAGLGLALLGSLFIYEALTLRTERHA